MVFGALFYVVYVAQFNYLNTYLLYITSAGVGFGAAMIWSAQVKQSMSCKENFCYLMKLFLQGNFLSLNSDPSTMSRNSGIFWAMITSSVVIGNTFAYFEFQGLTDIDTSHRITVSSVLAILCACSMATFLLLRPIKEEHLLSTRKVATPKEAFLATFKLLSTPDMLLLTSTFFYMGLVLEFRIGEYGSCIGNVMKFGIKAKGLVGLHGIMGGVGAMTGGLLFGIFGKVVIRHGRNVVVTLGFIVHMIAFVMIYIDIPNMAPFGNTNDSAIIDPNPYIAIACSYLLGFGDACFNTQIMSLLGTVYTAKSASAFSIFKFVQSSAAAIAFFISTIMPLHYQLSIMGLFGIFGTTAFLKVELSSRREEKMKSIIQDAISAIGQEKKQQLN